MVAVKNFQWEHTFTTEEQVRISRAIEDAYYAALTKKWEAEGQGTASGSMAGASLWREVAAQREAALRAFDRTGKSVEDVRRRARAAFERYHAK